MIKKLLLWGAIAFGGFVLGLFVASSLLIGNDVKIRCEIAMEKYEKEECVDGLIEMLNDENNTFRERNSAVWALGQLGDERALETLESYYTGEIPDREPLNKGLSQYELSKAIKYYKGGVNLTHIVRTAWDWLTPRSASR